MPVTYADVWEYWLRNREVYEAVDFITIHILPYWEDVPVKAQIRARPCRADPPAHGGGVSRQGDPDRRDRLAEQGRMREGALPSRTNQARVVSEILANRQAQNFRVNLIEAYDQPWKRQLEGTVGGYWGLLNSVRRELKYPPGEPISNFPFWKWHMGAGMVL